MRKWTKVCTSPLRYAGGKTRAVDMLLELFPKSIVRIVSPFCGGSSVELASAQNLGVTVTCYDAHRPLIDFFHSAVNDNGPLVKQVVAHHQTIMSYDYDSQKVCYRSWQQTLEPASGNECAAAYFAVNRASFSGAISAGMSRKLDRFNEASIKRLKRFGVTVSGLNISWSHGDFKDTIPNHANDFLFLDPPYWLKPKNNTLYGVKGEMHDDFDHAALATLLKGHGNWLLCYNDSSDIRDLYQGFCILEPKWAYGMKAKNNRKAKDSSEVFILSPSLEQYLRTSENQTFLDLEKAVTMPRLTSVLPPQPFVAANGE